MAREFTEVSQWSLLKPRELQLVWSSSMCHSTLSWSRYRSCAYEFHMGNEKTTKGRVCCWHCSIQLFLTHTAAAVRSEELYHHNKRQAPLPSKGTYSLSQHRGHQMDGQGVLGNGTILLTTAHQSSPRANFFCGQEFQGGVRRRKKNIEESKQCLL